MLGSDPYVPNVDVNSPTFNQPVNIIIENGNYSNTHANGGLKLNGLIYFFDHATTGEGGTPTSRPTKTKVTGSLDIVGGAVFDATTTEITGSLAVSFRPDNMPKVSNGGGEGDKLSVAWVPGTWRDFQ